jgi:hypothetical protein
VAERGVEVAVGLLRPLDDLRQLGDRLRGERVAGAGDLPGHALDELVDVGVGELAAAAVAAHPALDGGGEVVDPADPALPAEVVLERGRSVHGLAAAPETPGDAHLTQSERAQPAGARHHGARHHGARHHGPAAGVVAVSGIGGQVGGHDAFTSRWGRWDGGTGRAGSGATLIPSVLRT